MIDDFLMISETEQSENQNKFQDAAHQDIYANLLINHLFSKYSPSVSELARLKNSSSSPAKPRV